MTGQGSGRFVWLGKLADVAGAESFDLPLGTAIGWDELLAQLSPDLAEALRGARVRVAQNGVMIPDKAALMIAPGDEIAFLPPVSGG